MLKSYEAIYENGQIRWVSEQPLVNAARVIVTFIEETLPSKKRRTPPGEHPLSAEILKQQVNH